MADEENKPQEAEVKEEVDPSPVKGKDSIRMRADALEVTLQKAAKKHSELGLINPGYLPTEPSENTSDWSPKDETASSEKTSSLEPPKDETGSKSHAYPSLSRSQTEEESSRPISEVFVVGEVSSSKEIMRLPSISLPAGLKSRGNELDERSLLKDDIKLGDKKKTTFDIEGASKAHADTLASAASHTSTSSDEESREKWGNPIEFLLSCVAMSVGLGNVWRFPFTAYENGGGAFIIPYLCVLFFIGRPLYFMEMSLGQFASRSSVKVWDMVPAARGVGCGQMIATISVISYYTSLIGMAVFYIIASCTSETLPWMVCDTSTTPNHSVCIDAGQSASDLFRNITLHPEYNGSHPMQNGDGDNKTIIGSAEQYFKYNVLKEIDSVEDGIGNPDWRLALCLGGCYVLVFLTLWKGVASSGKVAYFTALFPYAVLFGLLAKGLTLPGAWTGIYYYIRPQWDKLLTPGVWYAAVTQSFFSLSIGFGPIITYSSYNDFRHNAARDALIISLVDTFTSMLAGFTIFAVLGNLSLELGLPIDKVIKSGTGLAFISYPMALGKIDYLPQVFAFLFFLMLITLGLGSVAGLSTGVISVICDQKPSWSKTKVTFGFCVAGFLVGLVYVTPGGQHVLQLVDYFGGGFTIFALTTIEVVAVSWIYGVRRLIRDIKFMLNVDLGLYWKFCWGLFIPVALSVILGYSLYTFKHIEYSGVLLPDYLMYIGWAIAGLALFQIPYWFTYEMFFASGSNCTQKWKNTFRSNDEWGPKKTSDRLDWMNAETNRELDEVLK